MVSAVVEASVLLGAAVVVDTVVDSTVLGAAVEDEASELVLDSTVAEEL